MRHRRKSCVLRVESLEGRALLAQVLPGPSMVRVAARNPADGSGVQAILAALNGGAGSEFVTLIRRGVPNIGAVVRQFALGQRTSLTVNGFAVKTPKLLPSYAGPQLDQFNPTASGAVLLRNGQLELAAIMRGPIDLPVATTFVWGIDRGSAASDPEGFGLPKLRYDAVVSVTREGSTITASVTDRNTGQVTALDPSSVRIDGPTIRVFLDNPAQVLPTTGKPIQKYKFSFWTRSGEGGIETVGSFVSPSGSIPIGVLGRIPKVRVRSR